MLVFHLQILDSDQTSSGRSFDLAYPGQLAKKQSVDYKVHFSFHIIVVSGLILEATVHIRFGWWIDVASRFVINACSVADPEYLSRIPYLNFFPSWIRIFPSRIRIKEFKLNPKKWYLSSQKYDSGCSSRIRVLTLPGIQGSKRHRIPDRDPQH